MPIMDTEYNSWNYSLEENVTFTPEKNDTYPDHMRFNGNFLSLVLVYSALFLVAAVGNLTVFISLFRSRRRKSRISLMIRHLAIADLFVTFFNIPLEVFWRLTVQWLAGNLACKVFLFVRAFGLYLSSNVLVCVSLDRYFAVLHPLKVNDARRRGKLMLACAWGISFLYSVPQSIVFHVSSHPDYPTFQQCVTFGFFTSITQEIAYNLFCVAVMYFIPLLVIITAYTAIMCEIYHKSKEKGGETYQTSNGRMRLRRSDISNIERARSRTLRMTVTIVLVFVWCWTPYVVMTLWYMFSRASAENVPRWIQDALFMMAVSNSCMNPLVYGTYAINFRKEFGKCFGCFGRPDKHLNHTIGSATRSTAMLPLTVNENHHSPIQEQPTKKVNHLRRRPPSVGHIAFLSENRSDHRKASYKFYSEPTPCHCGRSPDGSVETITAAVPPRGSI